jgi:hypothetical protein
MQLMPRLWRRVLPPLQCQHHCWRSHQPQQLLWGRSSGGSGTCRSCRAMKRCSASRQRYLPKRVTGICMFWLRSWQWLAPPYLPDQDPASCFKSMLCSRLLDRVESAIGWRCSIAGFVGTLLSSCRGRRSWQACSLAPQSTRSTRPECLKVSCSLLSAAWHYQSHGSQKVLCGIFLGINFINFIQDYPACLPGALLSQCRFATEDVARLSNDQRARSGHQPCLVT